MSFLPAVKIWIWASVLASVAGWTLSDNVAVQRLIRSIAQHLTYVPQGSGTREVTVELAA